MERLITMLTDFGLENEYVGVMKGVILSRLGTARIIDLCHEIPPRDISRAAYLLEASHRFFPAGTLHVAVIDPGVGTSRRIVLLEAAGQLFLAPDNGVLTLVARANFAAAFEVTCRQHFLEKVSNTFHGRDIFAPVAAELARGLLKPAAVGPPLSREELVDLPLAEAELDAAGTAINGQVVDIDRFGNLLTNIHFKKYQELAGRLPSARLVIQVTGRIIDGLSPSYGSALPGGLLAIFSSRDYLEIAVNRGNAARDLEVEAGEKVVVRVSPGPG
jgi:S-adenosyl-L-methionine hydrolase (adenosine-forming)